MSKLIAITSSLLFMTAALIPTSFANAIVCNQAPISGQAARTYVAHKKFSPFTAMLFSSLVGNIAASATLIPDHPSRNKRRSLAPVAVAGGLAWGTSAFMVLSAANPCKPSIEDGTDLANISKADLDLTETRWQRKIFLTVHAINTVPTLLFTLHSERKDRWTWFAGAAALPFVVDLALRTTIHRDSISPWALRAGIVQSENQIAPGLQGEVEF